MLWLITLETCIEMKREELNTQIAVVNYLTMQYPNALFCASAGGLKTTLGQAKNMKLAGYKKGFPDLFIYEPRGGFNGLAIELKKHKGGKEREEQREWIRRLLKRAYSASIEHGFDNAKNKIDWYFSL